MKRLTRVALAASAAALWTAAAAEPALAAVIVSGGPPDLIGSQFAQSPGMIAMSFFLATGESAVGGALWWGACSALGCTGPVDFVLRFYDTNAAGLPGDLAAPPIDVGAADQKATGRKIGGRPEYGYGGAFNLLMLTAGKQYWLAITETAPQFPTGWSLELTSSAPAGEFGAVFNGSSWSGPSSDATFAFDLTDGVTLSSSPGAPEPSTWTMMGLGFAGLGLISRRWARRRAALG